MRQNVSRFVMLLLFVAFIWSCEEEKGTDVEFRGQPTLPPTSTFVIDFSDFNPTAEHAQLGKIASRNNWGWAAINAGIWQGLLTSSLAVPVAAFTVAVNQEPELLEDGRWLWAYAFQTGNTWYSAELYASVVAFRAKWQMFISRTDHYEDFLWYEGESSMTAQEGSWDIYRNPEDPVRFMHIDWERNPAGAAASVTYEIVDTGSELYGSTITYGILNDDLYDAFYNIFYKTENHEIEINWDRATGAGQVRDSVHFEDDAWHCWDENLDDSSCQ